MKKYSDITGYSDEKYKLLYGTHLEDYDSITVVITVIQITKRFVISEP